MLILVLHTLRPSVYYGPLVVAIGRELRENCEQDTCCVLAFRFFPSYSQTPFHTMCSHAPNQQSSSIKGIQHFNPCLVKNYVYL